MSKRNQKQNQKAVNQEPKAEQMVAEEGKKAKKVKKLSPKQELEVLKMEHAELKDKFLRLFAEFDNYKKRTIKEKIDLMKTAAQDTMTALLPVLDDFDRAKKNAEAGNNKETFSEGVKLVYHKLYTILEQKGLQLMETDGEPFDPELHEAFTEIPAPTVKLKGKIVDTIEKGYLLRDKIIRHAKVVVGK